MHWLPSLPPYWYPSKACQNCYQLSSPAILPSSSHYWLHVDNVSVQLSSFRTTPHEHFDMYG